MNCGVRNLLDSMRRTLTVSGVYGGEACSNKATIPETIPVAIDVPVSVK